MNIYVYIYVYIYINIYIYICICYVSMLLRDLMICWLGYKYREL